MRIRFITASVSQLIVGAALTVNAQAPKVITPLPPNAPPPATQTTVRAQHADGAITITGCLQEDKALASRRSAVGEPVAPVDTYVLTGVKMSTSSHVSGIGVSTKYEVRGLSDMDLKKHVNHQVELTGQVAPPETNPAGSVPAAFQATALKMIAAVCGAEQ